MRKYPEWIEHARQCVGDIPVCETCNGYPGSTPDACCTDCLNTGIERDTIEYVAHDVLDEYEKLWKEKEKYRLLHKEMMEQYG